MNNIICIEQIITSFVCFIKSLGVLKTILFWLVQILTKLESIIWIKYFVKIQIHRGNGEKDNKIEDNQELLSCRAFNSDS